MNTTNAIALGQISPQIAVRDLEQAIEYYENVFGMSPIPGAAQRAGVSVLSNQGTYLTLVEESETARHFGTPAKAPQSINVAPSNVFTIPTENVQETYQRAIEYGGADIQPPQGAQTSATFRGVEGYIWRLIPSSQAQKPAAYGAPNL